VRDIVVFLLILVGLYVAVGEWRGWYLGVPGQTPVVLYKKDHVARTPVRTVARSDMPIAISGRVTRGSVKVQVFYERPTSFQTNAPGLPERLLYEATFSRGQLITLNQVFSEGRGIYTIAVTYVDASGTFRFQLPRPSEL
jgi:hypothetical protein